MKVLADAAGLGFQPDHEPSLWLRETISDLRASIMAAAFRLCPHLRPGMVVVTALWAPGRMVCTACLPMLAVAGDEDRTCDRCGDIVEAGQIHPGMTSLDPSGSLLVLLGLCPTCSRREVAA
ncbi:hypothetical protein [Modestobacter excelsi]|uniref:hypothetical protein n=1 Tax=Modestobacter excelsi TaxID=2213161 RepID=UPI00110D034D|nr:hypothetical protein [Modestobacter excelsi]